VPEADTEEATSGAGLCIQKGAEIGNDFGQVVSLAVIEDARTRFPENAQIAQIADAIGSMFGDGLTSDAVAPIILPDS